RRPPHLADLVFRLLPAGLLRAGLAGPSVCLRRVARPRSGCLGPRPGAGGGLPLPPVVDAASAAAAQPGGAVVPARSGCRSASADVSPRARRFPPGVGAAPGGGLSRSAGAARRARKGVRRSGGLGARGLPAEVSLLPVFAPVVLVLRPGP